MIYATTPKRRVPRVRRIGLGGTHYLALGDDSGDGFSWSNFGTSIAEAAAQGAASSGIQLLNRTIAGTPKPIVTAPAAPAAAMSTIPTWAWMAGGVGLLLVLVIAMKR